MDPSLVAAEWCPSGALASSWEGVPLKSGVRARLDPSEKCGPPQQGSMCAGGTPGPPSLNPHMHVGSTNTQSSSADGIGNSLLQQLRLPHPDQRGRVQAAREGERGTVWP